MEKKQGFINFCPVCKENRLFQLINTPVFHEERVDDKKVDVKTQRCRCEKCGYCQNYKFYLN